MRDALVCFVREGGPGGNSWPPYELERRSTFLFDDVSAAVEDPDRELREAFEFTA